MTFILDLVFIFYGEIFICCVWGLLGFFFSTNSQSCTLLSLHDDRAPAAAQSDTDHQQMYLFNYANVL